MTLRHAAALALVGLSGCAIPLTPVSLHQSSESGCYGKSAAVSVGFLAYWQTVDLYCDTAERLAKCETLHPVDRKHPTTVQVNCHPMSEFPETPPVTGCELCAATPAGNAQIGTPSP